MFIKDSTDGVVSTTSTTTPGPSLERQLGGGGYIHLFRFCPTSFVLKSVSHISKNSPEFNIVSVRLRFLVFIYQGQGVKLKKTRTKPL